MFIAQSLQINMFIKNQFLNVKKNQNRALTINLLNCFFTLISCIRKITPGLPALKKTNIIRGKQVL